jgi:hypothetical protein
MDREGGGYKGKFKNTKTEEKPMEETMEIKSDKPKLRSEAAPVPITSDWDHVDLSTKLRKI